MDRRRLGKFDVLCRLSTGGMSEIHLAVQGGVGGFNKLVVLKTILPDISGEEDFVRMFLDEARITAAFNHPNIAHVYELDTDEDTLFMAMEFVQGCTLVEMARACRLAKEPIPIGMTLAAVRDTALALHYAHSFVDPRGRRQIVIHRDVAEKNIMVTYEGVTKLLDFGIAKALGRSGHTSVGMVKGTSGYMSPEQIRGEPLDPRSDVFSLGVVLHECLTGLRLFHGKSPEEGMKAALHGAVAPPSKWNKEVRPEMDAVVLKALQRGREGRFATGLEFARAVEKVGANVIWHPEQVGELVMRHFKDRRAETRRLLDEAYGHEATGEVRVQSLIARMKADGEQRKASTSGPLVTASPVVPPPTSANSTTQPSIVPDLDTSPARPQLVMKSALPVPVPVPVQAPAVQRPAGAQVAPVSASPSSPVPAAPPSMPPMVPAARPAPSAPPIAAATVNLTSHHEFDDDDSDAKTIPATALPSEIRELRRRLQEQAAARRRETDSDELTIPLQVGVLFGPEGSVPAPPVPAPAPVPSRPVVQPSQPRPPKRAPLTGETLSVTGRGAPNWTEADARAPTGDVMPAVLAAQASNSGAEDFVPTAAVRSGSKARSQQARVVQWVLLGVLLGLIALGTVLLFQ